MYKYTGMILFESKIVKNQKKKKKNQTTQKEMPQEGALNTICRGSLAPVFPGI